MSSNKDLNLPDVGPNLTAETLATIKKLLSDSQGSHNPQGPTAPQAPLSGPNADVTGARPLHSETVPSRQLDIQPTVKQSVFTPRPQTTHSSSTGESSMSDDMLQSVSAYTMTSIIHHGTATFTPNSHAMYVTLAQMDKTMSTTKRWLDNSFGWIPAYSRLYYGVLFVIQTLRAQRDAGTLELESLPMLEVFELYFNPGNLLIAGPLVPIFKAISTSKVDSDLFGNVAPQLPTRLRMSENGTTHPEPVNPDIKHHLPAIPALFDEICTSISLGPGANEIYQQIHTLGSAPGSFGTAFTATAVATDNLNMPGLAQTISLTELTVNSFYQCSPSYSFPAPYANATLAPGITNWFQYCRLATGTDGHHEWLSRLSGTMNNYAQFFRGSIPLGEISSSSLPTGQVKGQYRPNTLPTDNQSIKSLSRSSGQLNTTGYYYSRPEITSLSANWTSSTMAIPIPEEWRAFYSQINCLHNLLTPDPPRTHHSGTFWTLPTVRTATSVDPINSIPLLIARKFHRSNRDETI
jgi:hypothetical protein